MEIIPSQLQNFLSYLISGIPDNHTTKLNSLMNSIGQDICRAATHGQLKLPKHILICMILLHLFRSTELTTLINHFGHSESYLFSLELETAIATSVQQTSDLLSIQIVRNPNAPSIFHSKLDNFDQLLNDLTGNGSIHTAHRLCCKKLMET